MAQSGKERIRFATKNPVGIIDTEKGIIFGISVLTVGEAQGHGMYVDETMVDQAVALGAAQDPVGVKCRFDHPNACGRSMGTFVGRFHEFRRDEDQARADLHIAEAAADSPDGDFRNYILELASEDPKSFATSIVFRPDEPFVPDSANKGKPGYPPEGDPFWFPHARIKALHQCDVVDEGAANDGLFGRPDYWAEQAERWADEHPNIVGRIISRYYERKQQTEDRKMSDRTLEVVEKELAAALAKATTADTALTEANTKIEAFESEKTRIHDEAFDEGGQAMIGVLQKRVEVCGDAAFAIETGTDTEEAFKDKCIAKLKEKAGKKAGDEDGQEPVTFSDADEDEPKAEKFEDLVSALAEKEEISRGAATQRIAKENPKAHAEYKKRMRGQGPADDDEE